MSPLATSASGALGQLARRWTSRLLTHVCRDSSSPHFGCFDRDWWHYRIRDFPSIILQQGGYALWLASQLGGQSSSEAALRKLAAASCCFWNQRAVRHGAFEEYYPWEQGYPPLAFSTLSVMKLAAAGVVTAGEIRSGATVAARQLLARFESRAANQQVAGLAALAWCRKNFPELVPGREFESMITRTLALQHDEGWFEEYGGPDLGYLSVTVDCLWDLFDATGDERFVQAIDRAFEFVRLFVSVTPDTSIGMHNSRNTDYLVPYGLVRASQHRNPMALENSDLVGKLFARADDPSHFLGAVDDRYVCHYIGQSVLRAALFLEKKRPATQAAISAPASQPFERLTASGHFLKKDKTGDGLIVTLRKGGVFSHYSGGDWLCDFGWIVKLPGAQFISHWWSNDWKYSRNTEGLWVEGALYEHREIENTPLRHAALRMGVAIAGRRLIGALKKRLIFEKARSQIGFRRVLTWETNKIIVTDTFTNVPEGAQFVPAPRSSKRHVASADSFHAEDLTPMMGFEVERSFHPQPHGMKISTVYSKTSHT